MSRAWLLQPLSHAVLASALCGLTMGLLLLPQVGLQRPMSEGVISLHLAADGGLMLWNQPIAAAELRRLLAAPSLRSRANRLRIVPDPHTPWGDVRRLLSQLDSLPLTIEIQLPSPTPKAG